jgi:hypothetical protein
LQKELNLKISMEENRTHGIVTLAVVCLSLVVFYQQTQIQALKGGKSTSFEAGQQSVQAVEVDQGISPLEFKIDSVSGNTLTGTATYSVFVKRVVEQKNKKLSLLVNDKTVLQGGSLKDLKPGDRLVGVATVESPEDATRLTVKSAGVVQLVENLPTAAITE